MYEIIKAVEEYLLLYVCVSAFKSNKEIDLKRKIKKSLIKFNRFSFNFRYFIDYIIQVFSFLPMLKDMEQKI